MREVQEEIGFYENLLGKDGTFVVPSGIRNKSSHGNKMVYEYEQLVFDVKPSLADITAECNKLGLEMPDTIEKTKVLYTSNNSVEPIIQRITNNNGYSSQRNNNEILVYSVNGPNQNFYGDWEKLQNEKPHLIGKWVVPVMSVATGKKAARNPDTLIKETTIFAK